MDSNVSKIVFNKKLKKNPQKLYLKTTNYMFFACISNFIKQTML